MSKKKHDVMQRERVDFIKGCVKNGVSERIAGEIFEEMSSFASYAFNKSHAAAYALVAYRTVYLKAHYKREYMAALLTSVLDFTEKVIEYIAEARKLGIAVLPPDVNESGAGFAVVGESIRFGLLAVKNLGRGFIAGLIIEREKGPFKDLLDFLERMAGKELNRRVIENLIKCGAFDSFGHRRSQMIMGYDKLLEDVEARKAANLSGQLDLFGGFGGVPAVNSEYFLPNIEEYPLMKMLTDEKETTGLYISGHPAAEYEALAKRLKLDRAARLHESGADNARAEILGIVTGKKLKTTKHTDMMAFVELEDTTAAIEVIVFPKIFAACSGKLGPGAALYVRGRVKTAEEDAAQLVAEEILLPEELEDARSVAKREQQPKAEKSANNGLYLKFSGSSDTKITSAVNVLKVFEGPTPVYFYYKDTGKYVRTPQEYWVSLNEVMLGELSRILGERCVAVKQ
jgi:DNA polymerase-3 subunit alpha